MEPLLEDLKEVHKILTDIKIPNLIVGGVLLSNYRDNKQIPTDGDIDFIIPGLIKKREQIQKAFEQAGYSFEFSKPKPFFGEIITLFKRVKTDLLIHELYKGEYVLSYNQHYRYYPKTMFDKPTTISITGTSYDCPNPIEDFLFLKYGDWKTFMAPIIEQKKTLSKPEYEILFDEKIGWRNPNETWQGKNLLKEMEQYYQTIVYTAGCFDIIHKGHIEYINKCKELGHKLIIGLGTDEYIKNFKGPKRPIMNYDERKSILASIKGVYKVVPHAPEYDTKVYDEENINLLVISEDFADTPEHKKRIQEAKKRRIKIIVLQRTKEISTSKIIKRCKK